MSLFSAHTGKTSQIAGNFSGYRRNNGYDSKSGDGRFRRTEPLPAPAGDDAMAQRRTIDGFHGRGAVRRRDPAVSPAALLAALGKFLWSIMKRVLKRLQPVSIGLFLVVVTFLIGFVVFAEKVTGMQPPALDEPADAIVVLTGGPARVQTGLELLKDKRGGRLLISGVHPSTNEKSLQRATHADAELFDCCVDLGRTARNTVGNAMESERWIRANNYRRVIVVTSNYHMPRSLLELSRRMQDVEFIPYPAAGADRRGHGWVAESETLRVLFVEYAKYLGATARAGLSTLTGYEFPDSGAEE